MRRSCILITPLFLLAAQSAKSQSGSASGRAITPMDYETWKSIGGTTLSRDGKWALYTLSPAIGEGEIVARSTTGSTEYRYGTGYVARPAWTVSGGRSYPGSPMITADSRWVIFMIDPSRDSVEQARRDKTAPDKQAKNSLGIMDLTTGQVTRIPRVRSFQIPKDAGSYLAYVEEPTPVKPDTTKPPADTAKGADKDKKKPKEKDDGAPLVLRDLSSGKESRVDHVATFTFTDSGTTLVYSVSLKAGGDADGVYVKMLSSGVETPAKTLASGAGHYSSIVLDRAGRQVAFITDKGEFSNDKPRYALYYAKVDGSAAREVVGANAPGTGMLVSDRGSVSFNKGGQLVSFDIAPVPPDTISSALLADEANFDLWHYKDPFLMTQELKEPDFFTHPRYQAVYWPGTDRWVKTGNDTLRSPSISDDGKVALAISIYAYTIQSMWGEQRYDVFLVDPTTGQWKPIKKNMPTTGGYAPSASATGFGSEVALSPGGKFVMLFENKQWSAYDVSTGKTVNLTSKITGVRFDDETDDHPVAAGPHGIAGWTKNDDRVFISDRWDIWEIDPTGVKAPRNATAGLGRKSHTTFRFHQFDYENPYLETDKPILLSATNDDTMDSGYWQLDLKGTGAPTKIIMVSKGFSIAAKAKNAEQYLVTQSTFREYPDLWTGPSITSLQKISNANPQQAEYRWGTASLVHYKNREGVPLKGIIHKPDGFDPKKKYPMVVLIYEKRANGLHQYEAPAPVGAAELVPATYVSKGYLVLQPDIVYRDGHPGMSAVSAVVNAVQAMIDSGYVDPKRVGLVGHSWGGYQDAFIATKTNVFRAIASGAPVSNMTSAYGGIRWGSGLNRSWQYEHSQSRIGSTPWDSPALFLENSTLFHVKNIHTPIMIMHNDNDGAVPWYQGIELYIALRRLGKETYFFNYNGEEHGTGKLANSEDWDSRQMQFFDHYLMDAPMPDWMAKGIPVNMKGRDQVPVVVKQAERKP